MSSRVGQDGALPYITPGIITARVGQDGVSVALTPAIISTRVGAMGVAVYIIDGVTGTLPPPEETGGIQNSMFMWIGA